jgi:lactate dehydrogenase-like 2-hydroxyacid dehydrogenase
MFDTVRQIQEGKFFYDQDTLFDIKGKAVWILWTWRIGQEIAKQVHALGAHILATDLYPNNEFIASVSGKYVSQEELFRTVDILFLVCPATKENENLINVNTISLMKKGVYLINVARWNLVDEDALLTHAEHFGFIGLDTIKDETSQGLQKFAHKHNILITPHVAYLADSSLATIRETTYRLLAA